MMRNCLCALSSLARFLILYTFSFFEHCTHTLNFPPPPPTHTLTPTYCRVPAFLCGSTVAVKNQLDEASASFLTDVLSCDEDFTSSNNKLGIMTFACVVALVAQFFPLELGYGRLVVGLCCALYFAASGILQVFIFYVDGDVIYTSLPDESRGGNFLVLRTDLERYEETYKIILEVRSASDRDKVLSSQSCECSVGKFFTKEGEFYEAALDKEMEKLVEASIWSKKNE